MTKHKIEPNTVNTSHLYTISDIATYTNLKIRKELGGYSENCDYLLRGQFFVKKKKGYVAIIPSTSIHLDPKNLTVFFYKDDKEGNEYQPYNENYDSDNERIRIGHNERDIFDELIYKQILNQNEANIKILFPYNLENAHWCLGEIIVEKIYNHINIEIFGHNPYGKEVNPLMDRDTRDFLENSIIRRLSSISGDFNINILNKPSPYNARQFPGRSDKSLHLTQEQINKMSEKEQIDYTLKKDEMSGDHDGSSCGVIVAEDLLLRIQNKTLDRTEPYPLGALDLRKKHLEYVSENANAKNKNLFAEGYFRTHYIPVVNADPIQPINSNSSTAPETTSSNSKGKEPINQEKKPKNPIPDVPPSNTTGSKDKGPKPFSQKPENGSNSSSYNIPESTSSKPTGSHSSYIPSSSSSNDSYNGNNHETKENTYYTQLFLSLAVAGLAIASVFLGNPFIVAPYLGVALGFWASLLIDSAAAIFSANLIYKAGDVLLSENNVSASNFVEKLSQEQANDIGSNKSPKI